MPVEFDSYTPPYQEQSQSSAETRLDRPDFAAALIQVLIAASQRMAEQRAGAETQNTTATPERQLTPDDLYTALALSILQNVRTNRSRQASTEQTSYWYPAGAESSGQLFNTWRNYRDWRNQRDEDIYGPTGYIPAAGQGSNFGAGGPVGDSNFHIPNEGFQDTFDDDASTGGETPPPQSEDTEPAPIPEVPLPYDFMVRSQSAQPTETERQGEQYAQGVLREELKNAGWEGGEVSDDMRKKATRATVRRLHSDRQQEGDGVGDAERATREEALRLVTPLFDRSKRQQAETGGGEQSAPDAADQQPPSAQAA